MNCFKINTLFFNFSRIIYENTYNISHTEICLNTGMPEPARSYPAKIYPNPSAGIINIDIKFDDVGIGEVKVYNSQGSLVYKRNVWLYHDNPSPIVIDIDFLDNGIYVILLNTTKIQIKEKILII